MKSLLFAALPLLLLCAGCGAPDPVLIDRTYAGAAGSTRRVLVAYGTGAGSTAEVADRIAKTLTARGPSVDVKPVTAVPSLAGYDAVVLGGPMHAGKVISSVRDFAHDRRQELARVPVACFVTCLILKDDTPENRAKAASALDLVRADVAPVSVGLFAGKLDYSTLSFSMRFFIKYFLRAPEGDFRDWNAIEKWADELPPLLLTRRDTPTSG